MASSSGDSTVLQDAMEQRKRKRMLSNRESARRSRQRKQRQLDELKAQANQLMKENAQIVSVIGLTTGQYLGVDAENSVLRTQVMELSSRLQSLNEILSCCCMNGGSFDGGDNDGMMMMPWGMMMNDSVDMYPYC